MKCEKTCQTCRRFVLCQAEGSWSPCELWHPVRQTNADRIRAMSDEELADFMDVCNAFIPGGNVVYKGEWLDWLKKEAGK